ncbi:MAG: HAD family phosphatase [Clostridiales bacterium]|nr:HAD family phosphatase [Clostridiales bacterium]
MRKINYRLIISDYDNTLTSCKNQISKEVRKAIKEYVESGGIFAICTGRMLRSIMPQAKKLELKGLLAANQGIVIADIESGKLIKNGGMTADETAYVCRAIEKLNQHINLYSGDDLYTDIPKNNKYLKQYERIVQIKSIHIDGKASDFAQKSNLTYQKVAILIDPNERQRVYESLSNELGDKFDVTCSANVLVEVSPYGETKGNAVEFLAKHYGVPINKTIAVGDNLNDLTMIEIAGIGACVGNGVEELKRAANYVSLPSSKGGIAQIIERYGFA